MDLVPSVPYWIAFTVVFYAWIRVMFWLAACELSNRFATRPSQHASPSSSKSRELLDENHPSPQLLPGWALVIYRSDESRLYRGIPGINEVVGVTTEENLDEWKSEALKSYLADGMTEPEARKQLDRGVVPMKFRVCAGFFVRQGFVYDGHSRLEQC